MWTARQGGHGSRDDLDGGPGAQRSGWIEPGRSRGVGIPAEARLSVSAAGAPGPVRFSGVSPCDHPRRGSRGGEPAQRGAGLDEVTGTSPRAEPSQLMRAVSPAGRRLRLMTDGVIGRGRRARCARPRRGPSNRPDRPTPRQRIRQDAPASPGHQATRRGQAAGASRPPFSPAPAVR